MGLTEKVMAILFMAAAIYLEAAMGKGKVYKVGDSAGWTTISNVDYNKWASSKTFHVGDTIIFEYDTETERHEMIEVRHADFRTCNVEAPIKTYSSGNDSITIKAPGHYYFICSDPEHCQLGQKVDIRVLKTSLPQESPSPSGFLGDLMAPSPSPSPAVSKATSAFVTMWPWLSMVAVSVYVSAVTLLG